MRRTFPFIIVIVSLFSAALASNATTDTRDAGILGNYLEVRTADVWTGPCFANGEVNLVGKEAFMAWGVQSGSWNGVRLDGLKVVGLQPGQQFDEHFEHGFAANGIAQLVEKTTDNVGIGAPGFENLFDQGLEFPGSAPVYPDNLFRETGNVFEQFVVGLFGDFQVVKIVVVL